MLISRIICAAFGAGLIYLSVLCNRLSKKAVSYAANGPVTTAFRLAGLTFVCMACG